MTSKLASFTVEEPKVAVTSETTKEEDTEKKIKALNKKIRQIESLENKILKGL